MEYIDFSAYAPVETQGHTSKGDQLKWKWQGYWYKADYMGYEGLAEVLVSRLLRRTTLTVPFVDYEPAKMKYHGHAYTGCRSRDFLPEGAALIPLEKLFRRYTGEGLALKLASFEGEKERIRYTVEQVEKFTGLNGFGPYLTVMLEVDGFFLNEDRHTNNIAVLYLPHEDRYDFCPLFDHGLSLFSDTSFDFPMTESFDVCISRVEAKPFSRSFDDQIEAAEALYGIQWKIHFTRRDIDNEINRLREFYSADICNRVQGILYSQFLRYDYLVPSH